MKHRDGYRKLSTHSTGYGLEDAVIGKGDLSEMKPDRDDKVDAPEMALFVILADITDHMMTIRESLASNPAVVAATRGCDIRRYQDSMREEEFHCFESYVEAETHTGEVFWWLLDITRRSIGWTFERSVGRQTSDGEQPAKEFDDVTFEKFDDLAKNYVALMIEFEESAKNFGFRL